MKNTRSIATKKRLLRGVYNGHVVLRLLERLILIHGCALNACDWHFVFRSCFMCAGLLLTRVVIPWKWKTGETGWCNPRQICAKSVCCGDVSAAGDGSGFCTFDASVIILCIKWSILWFDGFFCWKLYQLCLQTWTWDFWMCPDKPVSAYQDLNPWTLPDQRCWLRFVAVMVVSSFTYHCHLLLSRFQCCCRFTMLCGPFWLRWEFRWWRRVVHDLQTFRNFSDTL